VRRTDGAIVQLGGELERRVLVALAVVGGAVLPIDALAEAVFGLDAVTNQRIRLQNHVSRLRKRLGPTAIVTEPRGYRLGPGCRLDCARFEEIVTSAQRTDSAARPTARPWAEALALWHGPPFDELSDWPLARTAAVRLEELRRVAEEEHAAALIGDGRSAQPAGQLETLVADEPLRERRWALLMMAMYRTGRQTEALRVFERARTTLVDHAGVSPGPDLVELHRRILVQDPRLLTDTDLPAVRSTDGEPFVSPNASPSQPIEDSTVARRSNLPVPADTFVGRERELERLRNALEVHRLVTVLAVGGMGKTRLALEAATRAPGFVDGTWLVELGSVQNSSDVVHAVASTLRLRLAPGAEPTDQVAEWCSSADALIILDTCEHVLEGVARLAAAILARGSTTTMLATSREALIVAGEHVMPLGPLAGPDDADELGDAVRLLVERVSAERPDFDHNVHGTALGEICRRLDGMPLAIELAAARMRSLTPTALVERLDERFRLLTGGRRTATERNKTLRATVDWSYDLLTPRQRWLFERLSVFTGSFDLDDVAAIAEDEPRGVDDSAETDVEVIDLLGELVDRSLVVASNAEPPYRLLETLRSYGNERLEAARNSDAVREIHASWFYAKAAKAARDICGPAEHAVYHALMAQLREYRAATAWAVDHHQHDLAVALAASVLRTTWLRAEILGAGFAPDIPDDAPVSDHTGSWQRWLKSAYLQFEVGDLGAADDALSQALMLDHDNAMVHAQCAVQSMLAGRPDDLLMHAESALRLAGDDLLARAAGFIMLADANLMLDRLEEARRISIAQREWAELLAWPSAHGWSLRVLALIEGQRDPIGAVEQMNGVLTLARQIESYAMEVQVRIDMVSLLMNRRPLDALTAVLQVMEVCRDHHDVGQGAMAMSRAGVLLSRHGDPITAARLLGNVGSTALEESTRACVAECTAELKNRLGDRYDEVVHDGAHVSRWVLLHDAIDAVSACIGRVSAVGAAVEPGANCL
jgi:predicted ATPase/DNA-binding SARP family transcriptional activator